MTYTFLFQMGAYAIAALACCILAGRVWQRADGWILLGDVCAVATAVLGTAAFAYWAGDQDRAVRRTAYRSEINSAYVSDLGCPVSYTPAYTKACRTLESAFSSSFTEGVDINDPGLDKQLESVATQIEGIMNGKYAGYIATEYDKHALSFPVRRLRNHREDLESPWAFHTSLFERYILVLLTAYLAVSTAVIKLYVTVNRLCGAQIDRFFACLEEAVQRRFKS